MYSTEIETEVDVGVEKLGTETRTIIDQYLSLPFGTKPSCPYFNNRRKKTRGVLRVLGGKGTPQEIIEEAMIRAALSHVSIPTLSTEKFKEFLTDNDFGVDCSGFAYHVLDTFLLETKGKRLASSLTFIRKGFLSKIITRLRPAENTSVATLRLNENSFEINPLEARIGDFITFIGTGKDKTYNHIVVITNVDNINEQTESLNELRITYTHSYTWPSDGAYGHGVREGIILIKNNSILDGIWKEKDSLGEENYTYTSARDAEEVSVRRLVVLK